MMAKLMNRRTGETISKTVLLSNTFRKRSKGLLGRDHFDLESTMWFPNCNSIHTWFMRFPIDVIFVDRSLRVKSIYQDVKPWRLILPRLGWKDTFEFASGALKLKDLKRGDQLYVAD